MDGQMENRMDAGWMDGQMNRWFTGWTDRRLTRWIDRQVDVQGEREKNTYPRESNAANGPTQHISQHCRIRVGSRKVCIEVRAVPVCHLKQCSKHVETFISNLSSVLIKKKVYFFKTVCYSKITCFQAEVQPKTRDYDLSDLAWLFYCCSPLLF